MNRLRSGGVGVISPFGRKMFEVSLLPEDVIAIVFWTKNAAPLLPYLDELSGFGYCFTFLYTINNYPAFLEPRVPHVQETLRTLETLCNAFPGLVIRWRYDTIVLTESLDTKWHLGNFARLCELLARFTGECIFSFCDYYRKTVRNMERLVPDHTKPDDSLCKELAEEMAIAAQPFGITLASCAHDFLVSDRISKARCIDPDVLVRIVDTEGKRQAVQRLKSAPSRKQCGCVASRDIGAYDTCLQGCVYCYANTNPERAAFNVERLDPESHCLDPYHR